MKTVRRICAAARAGRIRWTGASAAAIVAAIMAAACLAAPVSAQDAPRFEIGAGYTYVRANAPPGSCGCFGMNGGTVSAAVNIVSGLGVVADGTVVHSGNVNSSGQKFTLTSYVFGPRFTLRSGKRVEPFLEGLAGVVHASGLGYGTTAQPASALGAMAGGGIDLGLSPRIAVRLVEADYYFTHLSNGVNTQENNLRLTFGLVFRFGHH